MDILGRQFQGEKIAKSELLRQEQVSRVKRIARKPVRG